MWGTFVPHKNLLEIEKILKILYKLIKTLKTAFNVKSIMLRLFHATVLAELTTVIEQFDVYSKKSTLGRIHLEVNLPKLTRLIVILKLDTKTIIPENISSHCSYFYVK